ncbi:MAG: conjugal transfer protein TraC [Patescibacteria group bacterium]|nr:conjugal transfer protein TraC [Patescibacteria group bacterium]
MRSKIARQKITVSTQKYLDISGIRNDCVILRDGTLRAVLLCSSVNFALKSEEEQKAVISAYVNFLNSLDWPIQIVVQSRKLNIAPYLEELKQREKEQTNELLKIQMRDYISYVQELVQLGDIMTRKFFIVVAYNPAGDKSRKFTDRLMDVFRMPSLIRMKREKFERYRAELFKKVDFVISGLSSMGINAVPLDTQSLIELFYNIYNPTESINQKMSKIEELKVEL